MNILYHVSIKQAAALVFCMHVLPIYVVLSGFSLMHYRHWFWVLGKA